jgi:2-polyprenyl-6-methoxyphenol hydroxylase-like FAD-dependent oxidoreductase
MNAALDDALTLTHYLMPPHGITPAIEQALDGFSADRRRVISHYITSGRYFAERFLHPEKAQGQLSIPLVK